MRYTIYIFLFIPSILFAQTYSIQTTILDSLIFETVQGRACTKLSAAQTIENQKLQNEIVAQGTVIRLKTNEVTHLEEIISALQKESNATRVINRDRLDKFKKRIRRLTVMVVGESGLIVLLVIVLL